MKKKLILLPLVAMMMLPMAANAEEKSTSTFVEIQPSVGDADALQLQFGAMYKANEILSFGGGIGILEPYKFNVAPTIPIFVRAQAEAKMEGVTPFFSFDAGFGSCIEDFDASAVIINPMAGVKFGSVYAGIGYFGNIPVKGSGIGSSINFRLGYSFGDGVSKSAIKDFFSKTYFTVEIGGGMGLSSMKYSDYDKGSYLDDKVTLGNNVSAHISWMYKIDENWSAGIGAGLNTYMTFISNDHTEDTELVNSIPLYLRGQYAFMEEGQKFRPYIACDFGGLIRLSGDVNCSYNNYIVEPQIGVKFNDKYRVALGYSFCNADSYDSYYDRGLESKSVSSLNLKIGMDF